MEKTIFQKMGLKEKSRGYIANPQPDAVRKLSLSKLDMASSLRGNFDYLHLFVAKEAKFTSAFLRLKKHLKMGGSLWVSWPKSGLLESDLNIKKVIKLGYDCGLVESKALSINETWSALKFTHPKKGKAYNNSYGKLKS